MEAQGGAEWHRTSLPAAPPVGPLILLSELYTVLPITPLSSPALLSHMLLPFLSCPLGPCGPCSELYYDFHPDRGTAPEVSLEDDSRFIEFYNLVFMQLNRWACAACVLSGKYRTICLAYSATWWAVCYMCRVSTACRNIRRKHVQEASGHGPSPNIL